MGLSLYHFLNTGRDSPEDLATELLGLYEYSSDRSGQPQWFGRVLQLVYDAYGENLTLAAAAKVAGVHPVHVSRSFRRLLGCTFVEYLRQVRLRRAFDLLRSSTMALVDVALQCGFSDHSHMSRSFKRSTGITPSAYRTYF
jgi:AraC family transcriptional regulator